MAVRTITSERYHGRWYGIMICLGEESGKDMSKLLLDKGTEILTMLQISNEYPEDFNFVNKLIELEEKKRKTEIPVFGKKKEQEFLLGSLEAKKVYMNGKNWELLLKDCNLEDVDNDETDNAETETALTSHDAQHETQPISPLHTQPLQTVEKQETTLQQSIQQENECQSSAYKSYITGCKYMNGDGVAKDPQKAVEWFKKAAEEGNIEGITALGDCYFNGVGSHVNVFEAVKLYSEAAERGYANAQLKLGILLLTGRGVTMDFKNGIAWIEKAANQGNADAQTYLGVLYYTGDRIERDYNLAFKWFNKAAGNNPEASYYLSRYYMEGQGVEKNKEKAIELIKDAAQGGYAEAQYLLATFFDSGQIITQDYKQAFFWFEKAAMQNHPMAQQVLGRYYTNGIGVEKDYKKAAYWNRLAQAQKKEPELGKASTGTLVICFLFPIIGLVMSIAQRGKVENPGAYFNAGCLGFIIGLLLNIIVMAVSNG